jgi:hypothetical protein
MGCGHELSMSHLQRRIRPGNCITTGFSGRRCAPPLNRSVGRTDGCSPKEDAAQMIGAITGQFCAVGRHDRYQLLRRPAHGTLALIAGLILSSCSHAPSPNPTPVITAKLIQLVDENGRVRLLLKGTQGEPGLGIYDEHGQPLVLLTVFDGGSRLSFKDPSGALRAGFGIDRGQARMTLADSTEDSALILGWFPQGTGPGMVAYAANDSGSAVIGPTNGTDFHLIITGSHGKVLHEVP